MAQNSEQLAWCIKNDLLYFTKINTNSRIQLELKVLAFQTSHLIIHTLFVYIVSTNIHSQVIQKTPLNGKVLQQQYIRSCERATLVCGGKRAYNWFPLCLCLSCAFSCGIRETSTRGGWEIEKKGGHHEPSSMTAEGRGEFPHMCCMSIQSISTGWDSSGRTPAPRCSE